MRLVYEIDPDIPFLSNSSSASLSEIVKSFGSGNMTEDDWHSLTDGRLLSWMISHEDVMACESLRIMTQGQPFSMSLAYKVLYNLDRTAAYDLREANTPALVGELLCDLLTTVQHTTNDDLAVEMQDFCDENGRFRYYAQLHGWYHEMSEAERCFNLNSEENRERLSAYDLHTALYRYCSILGATPYYKLPDGTKLKKVEDVKEKRLANAIRNELRTGSLSQWLSVFYHENPNMDFAEEYSYEHELEKWLLALGELDAQQMYYKRFIKAREDTTERIAEVRHDWNSARSRELLWRYLYYFLAAVWIGLLVVVGIDNRTYILEHPYLTILLPVGSMTAVIVAIRAFFGGIGAFLAFLLGCLGFGSAFAPIYMLKFAQSWSPSLFIPVMVLISLIYMVICHLTVFQHDDKTSAKAIREILTTEDINTSLMEPLYYTFKTKSFRYKSTKFGLLDDISNQVRSISGENVLHYALWGLLFLILIVEFCAFSPKLLNIKNPTFGREEVKQVIEQVQNDLDE
jgi:hypothetical protein